MFHAFLALFDSSRDPQDVQFYTGECASKKFEVSRSLLPELYAGIQRLEAEEAERQGQEVGEADQAIEGVAAQPALRPRALSVLRRLAFGMQRCVARFIPYAIMRCRQHAVESAALRAPHLRVMPLEPAEGGEADALPIQEVADLEDDDAGRPPGEPRRQSQVVSHNQKDDYVRRGSSAVLACMSLVNYSRFVRRVACSRAGRADYVRYFPFEEHYAHYSSSLQARGSVS